MNIYKDKRDESLTDEEKALVALSIDENYLLKSNLIDIHVLWVIRDALEKQIKKSLLEEQGITHRCPYCENANYLPNEDEEENSYCGNCGQAIDWRNEDE